MPIKVSSPTPVKKILSDCDPDGDSWVMVKPITYRDDLLRGELLKDRETSSDALGNSVNKGINMYRLRAEELWLTYTDAHIVTVVEEEETQTASFKPRDEMARTDFMVALGALPPPVVLEWHRRMVEVNPDWAFPF